MKRIALVLGLVVGLFSQSIAEDPSIHRRAFIERERIATTRLLDVLNEIRELKLEYDSQGFSGTFVDQDFIDSNNNHINPVQFGDMISSQQAIMDLLAAGGNAHNTNLYRIVR